MSSNIEESKTLVRRFFAAIEAADFHVFDEIVAENYDDHLAGQSPGRETLKQYFSGLHSAFADLKLPISEIVAEGDKVAVPELRPWDAQRRFHRPSAHRSQDRRDGIPALPDRERATRGALGSCRHLDPYAAAPALKTFTVRMRMSPVSEGVCSPRSLPSACSGTFAEA
jgi:ketosteroid isomerase-like protein